MDIRAGFENCNGSVGIGGEDHLIARILQFDPDDLPDDDFIFHDEDGLPTSSSVVLTNKLGRDKGFKQSAGYIGFWTSPDMGTIIGCTGIAACTASGQKRRPIGSPLFMVS